jgi:hypothetical protein
VKKEELDNYEREEIERQKQYYRNALSTVVKEPIMGYQNSLRFKKLNAPVVLADTSTYSQYNEKIWSQVAFAGTLVIPINVATKENFLLLNSFDVSEIANLVQLSKDTGRVQFCLNTLPSKYAELDYLDPIFSELGPPILTVPLELYTDT